MAIEKVMILGAALILVAFIGLFGNDLLGIVQEDAGNMSTQIDGLRDTSGDSGLN